MTKNDNPPLTKLLTKTQLIDALLEGARRQVLYTNAHHPVDVANSLSAAIEAGGELLATLADQDFIDWESGL